MTENVRRRSNTRTRLLDAAEAIIDEAGILSFGIDAVCRRAEFTRGAFYSNFASIGELLFGLYERKTERLLTSINEAQADEHAPLDQLLQVVPADPQWFALRAMFAVQTTDHEMQRALRDHTEQLRDGLTPFVARLAETLGVNLGEDPAEATRVVIAANVGAVLQGALVADADRLRRDALTAAITGLAALPRPRRDIIALSVLPGSIHRIDTATGAITDLTNDIDDAPDGIAIDSERGEAIVSFMGQPDHAPRFAGDEPPFTLRNGSVRAISLADGSQRTLVGPGNFVTGKQLTRDEHSGRIYWSDREGHGIYRAEADGSDVTPLVLTSGTTPSDSEDECVGIAVDVRGGWLYWTQKGPAKGGKGRILRAALELPEGASAADRDDIEVLWHNLPEPIDLELDLAAGMLWWTDRGAEPDGNTLNRAPIPARGESGDTPQILARGFHEAIGLAIDHENAVAYVSELGGRIHEVSLVSGIVRTLAELEVPVTGIALA